MPLPGGADFRYAACCAVRTKAAAAGVVRSRRVFRLRRLVHSLRSPGLPGCGDTWVRSRLARTVVGGLVPSSGSRSLPDRVLTGVPAGRKPVGCHALDGAVMIPALIVWSSRLHFGFRNAPVSGFKFRGSAVLPVLPGPFGRSIFHQFKLVPLTVLVRFCGLLWPH